MRPRGHGTQVERSACGHHAAPAHVLGERGHRELLRDLRLADEGAAPAPADEHPLANEVVERCPNGETRHTEVRAELTLGRNGVADGQLLDQIEHTLARLTLLGDRRGAQAYSSSPAHRRVTRDILERTASSGQYLFVPVLSPSRGSSGEAFAAGRIEEMEPRGV